MTVVTYFSDTAYFSYYSAIIPSLEESQKIKQQIHLEYTTWISGKKEL